MKLLLIAQSFPPISIIGAVRPYETAKYFDNIGWDVTVICSYDDNCMPTGYDVDLGNIKVIAAPKNNYIAALNRVYRYKGVDIMKKIIRKLVYPEHFFFMVKDYEYLIEEYIHENGVPDFMLSTAKPLSSHIVASKIKNKYNSIKWVADFRDLWALRQDDNSNLISVFRKKTEIRITENADVITVVTETMKNKMSEYLNNDIHVIRNGADRVNNFDSRKICIDKAYTVSFTGILYGGFIDVHPLLIALENIDIEIDVNFYGSEKNIVSSLAKKYQKVKISYFERLPKKEIKSIQEKIDFLLVGLGNAESQKGVLTGKFFEYIETGKPIIAICDEDSELAELVTQYSLGIATRDNLKIKKFIEDYISGKLQLYTVTPKGLTRAYQLDQLKSLMLSL